MDSKQTVTTSSSSKTAGKVHNKSELGCGKDEAYVKCLEKELTKSEGDFRKVVKENELLKAVLQIVQEDLNVKNEQLENLYANLKLNSVWNGAMEGDEQHSKDQGSPTFSRRMFHLDERKESSYFDFESWRTRSRGVNHFETLPIDMHMLFCDYLDSKSLCAASHVCKEWFEVASDELLWKHSYQRSWPFDESLQQKYKEEFSKPWKVQYGERYLVQRNWVLGKPSVMTLSGHLGSITCLRYDHERLVTASDDGSLILWELHAPPSETDAKYSLVQQHHRQIRMTCQKLSFQGHGGPVWCLSLTDDTMVSGSYDKTLKIWSVKQGNCKLTLRGHEGWVSCVSPIHEGRVMSGSWDTTLKLWQLSDDHSHGQCLQTFNGPVGDAVYCLQWDTNQQKVATGNRHQSIKIWDAERGNVIRTYMGHTKQVYCLQMDNNRIISGSGDHTIKVWDVRTGASEMSLGGINGHHGPVMCLQFDQYKVVSGGYDKQVKIFDLRMQKCVHSLFGHSSAIFSLQYDTNKIITGSADKHARIWNFGA